MSLSPGAAPTLGRAADRPRAYPARAPPSTGRSPHVVRAGRDTAVNRPRFALGLALTAAAGAINAASISRLGAVYVSFMSGNTVQLGLHLAGADWPAVGFAAAMVGTFVLGAFASALAKPAAGPWHLPVVLLAEAAAVLAALYVEMRHAGPLLALAPLALAMGAQNQLVVLVRGANPATTFVTGTLVRFSDALAQRLLGRDPDGTWILHLAVWVSFALGTALGAVAVLRLAELALAPVAGGLALLAILSAIPLAAGTRRAGVGTPTA